MKKIFYTSVFLFFFVLQFIAQKSHVAFINGIAHVGNGQVINNCLLVIKDQRFEVVADASRIKLNYKAYDTVIDLEGKHIYPGIINTNNVLGLHDAEAVRATVDFADVGIYNPHIRSLIAYNTDNLI